jgi:Ca2+/Na+ antiporter
MEVYEMPITVEESRNYHKLLYQLKALNFVEWIKTYIFTVVFNMIFAFVIFTFSTNLALYIWNNVPMGIKLLLFVVVFFLVALQRSKNMQLKAMLQKYFINNIPQEFLSGGIQLKKIKVSKNSLKVYYRRFHTQDFK